MTSFVIPQRDDDLLVPSATYYRVGTLLKDADQIESALIGFKNGAKDGEFEHLSGAFDSLFPIIMAKEINMDQKIELFNALIQGVENFLPPLRDHLTDLAYPDFQVDENAEALKEITENYSNLLLMYFYLLSRLSHHFENHIVKLSRSITVPGRGARKAVQMSEDIIYQFWTAPEENRARAKLVKIFDSVACLTVKTNESSINGAVKLLWSGDSSNCLKNCVIETMRKFLENTDIYKAAGRILLHSVTEAMCNISIHHSCIKDVAKNLMDLSMESEYFKISTVTTFPLVQAILTVQKENDLEHLLTEMIAYGSRELDLDAMRNKGDSPTKAFCLFVTSLAEYCPELTFKNMSYIVPFLCCDPPIIRNAVLTAYTKVIIKCLNDKNLEPNHLKMRNKMLQALQDHITDFSAIVRTKVLNLWSDLAEKRMIPVQQFRLCLLTDIVNRLHDNLLNVRKHAAACLIHILRSNPFGENLSLTFLKQQFDELKQQYDYLSRNNPQIAIIQKALKSYEDIEEKVVGAMQELIRQFAEGEETLINRLEIESNESIEPQPSTSTGADQPLEQNEMHEQIDTYTVAKLVLDSDRFAQGCVAAFELYYRKNGDVFKDKNIDGEQIVEDICKIIKDAVQHYSLANRTEDDQAMLIEEENMGDFTEEVNELEDKISAKLDALLFASEIEKCLETALDCAKRTQQNPELREMIGLISECVKFKVRRSQEVMKGVFDLIWRKEEAIIDIIIDAGQGAYFSKNPDQKVAAVRTAQNLMEVMRTSNVEEIVSLEETFLQIISRLPREEMLFVDQILEQTRIGDPSNRANALRILTLVAKSKHKHLIRDKVSDLYKIYCTQVEVIRIQVLKILIALSSTNHGDGATPTPAIENPRKAIFRVPANDMFVKIAFTFLVNEFHIQCAKNWNQHCSNFITLVYNVCCRPYVVLSQVYAKLTRYVTGFLNNYNSRINEMTLLNAQLNDKRLSIPNMEENQELEQQAHSDSDEIGVLEQKLLAQKTHAKKMRLTWEITTSRYLHFLGELTMRSLTYLELTFTAQMKSSFQTLYNAKHPQQVGGLGRLLNVVCDFEYDLDTPLIQFEKDCIKQKGFFEKADREDDRIGLTAVSEEEKLQIKIQKLLDRDLFSTKTIIGRSLPIVLFILKSDQSAEISETVKEAAAICTAKFMLVNKRCCKKLLELFFDLYKDASVRLRNNMLIMMADLCFRFPNVFSRFNEEFIQKIRDPNSGIRYTCLLIISHMILNDLIRTSDKVAELTVCLFDEDKEVVRLARGFFTELSSKHNVLYNLFVNIIPKLASDDTVTEENFKEALTFLMNSLKKDAKDQKTSIKNHLNEFMSQNRNLLMSSESTSNKLEWLVDFLKKDIARLEKAKEAEDKNNPNNLAEI